VIAARKIQEERFKRYPGIHCNAQMEARQLREFCRLDYDCQEMMRLAMERFGMTARAFDRVVKVARTIADLANAPVITREHIGEALAYRSLDRDSWGR